jgi:hypothetical protein
MRLDAFNDLLARLTLAEARLAAHHAEKYDISCDQCSSIEPW